MKIIDNIEIIIIEFSLWLIVVGSELVLNVIVEFE